MLMMKVLEKRLGVGTGSGSLAAAFLQDPKLIALSVVAVLIMVIAIRFLFHFDRTLSVAYVLIMFSF